MSSKGGGGVEQLLYRGGITHRGGGVVVIQTNTFAGKHGSTKVLLYLRATNATTVTRTRSYRDQCGGRTDPEYCHVRTMIKKHPDLQPLKRNFAAKLMYCWPARFAK